jgi:hypothetical protein
METEEGAVNPIILAKIQQSKENSDGIKYISKLDYQKNHTGYVYLWTFVMSGITRYYLGYHKATVNNDKFYSFSSEDKTMNEWYCDSNCKKTMEILHWGYYKQMAKKEQELLQELKDNKRFIRDGGDYFNKSVPNFSNADKTTLSGINYKKVEKFSDDLTYLKSPNITDYTPLKGSLINKDMVEIWNSAKLQKIKNAQVRDKELDLELKQELKIQIQLNLDNGKPITKGAKKVIVLKDRWFMLKGDDKPQLYPYLLIGGKHTTEVYANFKDGVADLDTIMIPPEVHEQFNDVEIYKIGNNDNKKMDSSKPVTIDDLLQEYQYSEFRGILWNTPAERNRAQTLLRKDSWSSIKDKMDTYVDEKNNGKRIDYTKPDRLANVENNMKTLMNLPPETNLSNLKWVVDNPPTDGILHIGPFSSSTVNPYSKFIKGITNQLKKQNPKISNSEIKDWTDTNIKEVVYHIYFRESNHPETFKKSDSVLFDGCGWAYSQKLSYISLPERTDSTIV